MPRRKRKQSAWKKKRGTSAQLRSPISDSQVVKLKYGELVAINAGAGTTATHVFRANGCFDPNYTGVGHQPYGFDQWANFYDHITVIGSRIKCTFMPTGSAVSTGTNMCAITVEDDVTTSTSINQLLEKTGTVFGYSGLSSGKQALVLRKNFSTKKFFNLTDVKDNDSVRGLFTQDPTDQAYYHVMASSTDGSSDPGNVMVAVEIEYICVLSERKNLVES